MKYRHGFVSNSSSTSFTFCFKGTGIKPLTDLILTKYRDQFKCSFDEWHCNALEVVEEIENCATNGSEWHKVGVVSIDKVIEDDKAYVERLKKDIEEAKKKPSSSWPGQDNYILKHKQSMESKIIILQETKKKGLTTVLIMGFGDNHGQVSGGNVGYAMDYSGRDIDINEKDLVVFTEQNR